MLTSFLSFFLLPYLCSLRAKSGGGPSATGSTQQAPPQGHQGPKDPQQGARSKGQSDSHHHGEKGSMPQSILSKSRDARETPVKYQESPVEEAQEALSLSAFGATSHPDGSSPFSGSGSSHKQAAALPPTLAPSKAPAVSLIQGERPAVAGGSPKIIPPASTERVRNLTNPSSDLETSNQSSASSSIPFAYDTKAPAQVGINPVSASPCSGGSMEKSVTESASDQLRKLSSSWKDEASREKPGMEMRTMQHHREMDDDDSCHDDRDDASLDSGSSVDGGSQRTRHGSGTVHTL
ncbi:uncharacterized protein LOC105442128 [Strongylocentrotus purpuratus]|uniref:Uncharacterized protein n=1 Tax=Strongylocentrotus purpuratus TaxID=7668 RepID=A0A7M7NQM4_STRPU|nr:uncharacterized protein LOC105442128 [Strongylocentrotus purpuratus]